MESEMNIRIHFIELVRDLFFCGVLIAAGSGVSEAAFFDSDVWLNLIAGWFIVVLGLMGAVAVTVIAITKVLASLSGWHKWAVTAGTAVVAVVSFTVFILLILAQQPGL